MLRVAFATLVVVCTIAFAAGRDDHGAPLAHPHGDGGYYYVWLPSLWLDGDVDLDNQYDTVGNPWQLPRTPLDRAGNVFGIGPAVFESPLFVVGHLAARVGGGRSDGFSAIPIWLTGWCSVLATISAVWFAFRLVARRVGDEHQALAAALLAAAGGPVLFYAIRQPHMAHPFATLFAAWLVDAWDASYARERTARTWLYLGALLGAAILARPQLAPWALCLVAAGLSDLRAGLRTHTLPRVAGRLALGMIATLAVVAPQLVTWKLNYGSFVVVPQGDGFMRWDAPAWSETLFSSRNGLLPWSPLYALGLVGLVASIRRAPRLVILLVVGLGAQAFVNGAAWDWWAGGSLGARRFDSAYIAFAYGLGVVLVAARRHVIATVLCWIVVAWLAVASIALTLMTTPYTMRQKGGEPAADVMTSELGTAAAALPALASRLANLPARVVFALAHDTSLEAYDRLVGVHWLAETYPPLSTKQPRTHARREVADIPAVFRDGFTGDVLASGTGRVFIGLNRRGAVRVSVTLAGAPTTTTVVWNGDVVARTDLPTVTFDAVPRRGVNELAIAGQPGTRVVAIDLSADPDD